MTAAGTPGSAPNPYQVKPRRGAFPSGFRPRPSWRHGVDAVAPGRHTTGPSARPVVATMAEWEGRLPGPPVRCGVGWRLRFSGRNRRRPSRTSGTVSGGRAAPGCTGLTRCRSIPAWRERRSDSSSSHPVRATSSGRLQADCSWMPRATAKPSMSGRRISRKTTSGCRCRAASRAAAPSAATCTSWPSAWKKSTRVSADGRWFSTTNTRKPPGCWMGMPIATSFGLSSIRPLRRDFFVNEHN